MAISASCGQGPPGFGNNIYIVIDETSGEAAFIDAPDEVEKSIAAVEFAGVEPSTILLTHSHQDHTASIVALKERYGCRLIGDPAEPWIPEGTLDEAIADGDTVKVGGLTFDVVSIPGHTPASTAFIHGAHAFVGDTLFPGRSRPLPLERAPPAGDRLHYDPPLRPPRRHDRLARPRREHDDRR